MSDYKKGRLATNMGWIILAIYGYPSGFLLQNPRLGMLVRTFDKMPETKQQNHLKHANQFLDSL